MKHEYFNSLLHSLVGAVAKDMGIPDSCVSEVSCCDCGKQTMAANCYWSFNIDTGKYTGPHCGCKR